MDKLKSKSNLIFVGTFLILVLFIIIFLPLFNGNNYAPNYTKEFETLAHELLNEDEYNNIIEISKKFNDIQKSEPKNFNERSKSLANKIYSNLAKIESLAKSINPEFKSEKLQKDMEHLKKYSEFSGLNVWSNLKEDVFSNILIPKYSEKYEYLDPLDFNIDQIKAAANSIGYLYTYEYEVPSYACKKLYLCQVLTENGEYNPKYNYIEVQEDRKGNVMSINICGNLFGKNTKYYDSTVINQQSTELAKSELIDYLCEYDRYQQYSFLFALMRADVKKLSTLASVINEDNIEELGSGVYDLYTINLWFENYGLSITSSNLYNDSILISNGDYAKSVYELTGDYLKYPDDENSASIVREYINKTNNLDMSRYDIDKFIENHKLIDVEYQENNSNNEMTSNEAKAPLDIDYLSSSLEIDWNDEVDFEPALEVFNEYTKKSEHSEYYSGMPAGTCMINGNKCFVIQAGTPTSMNEYYVIDLSDGEDSAKIYSSWGLPSPENIERVQ